MKIAYLTQSVDHVSGLGRIVAAIGSHMITRGHEVSCVSQVCEEPRMQWLRIPRSHLSNGLDKILYRAFEPGMTRKVNAQVSHSMGVGWSADVVSAQSCHRAGMEMRNTLPANRIKRRNLGLYDRLSLADESRLMSSKSTRVIVAVSELVRNQLIHWYGIPQQKIVVIPNGIDTKKYAEPIDRDRVRTRFRIQHETTALGFLGNEFDRKGVQTIIEALPALRDLPVHLFVAGGDDSWPFQRLAEKLGVAQQVHFMGRITFPEEFLRVIDLFVFPVVYEPFGMVVIEAMAAGTPVITTESVGAVEGMTNGREGVFLQDPHSAQELSGAIRTVCEDRELRESLSQAGRLAAQKFEWGAIGSTVEQVYQRVLAEKDL